MATDPYQEWAALQAQYATPAGQYYSPGQYTVSASDAALQGRVNPLAGSPMPQVTDVSGGGVMSGPRQVGGAINDALGLTSGYQFPVVALERAAIDQAIAEERQFRNEQARLATLMGAQAVGAAPALASEQLRQGMAQQQAQAARAAASGTGSNRGLAQIAAAQQYGQGMGQAQTAGVDARMAELQRALGAASDVRTADLQANQARLAEAKADQEAYLTAVEANRASQEANKDRSQQTFGETVKTGAGILKSIFL